MKKVGFLLLLLIITNTCFSNIQQFEKLNIEKVISDIDTIKQEIDSSLYYINETYKILKEEVEIYGWKKTVQINSGIFLPYIIIFFLYILWLLGRTRSSCK